jgi:hypothetical protein
LQRSRDAQGKSGFGKGLLNRSRQDAPIANSKVIIKSIVLRSQHIMEGQREHAIRIYQVRSSESNSELERELAPFVEQARAKAKTYW